MAWPACVAFLRILGGLFRKNLFCDERASWDKRLNFLDWLIWHDLATGRKQREREKKKPYENDGCRYVTVYDSLNTLKTGSRMQPAVRKIIVSRVTVNAVGHGDAVERPSDALVS